MIPFDGIILIMERLTEWIRKRRERKENSNQSVGLPIRERREINLPAVDEAFTEVIAITEVKEPIVTMVGSMRVYRNGVRDTSLSLESGNDLTAFIPPTQELYYVPRKSARNPKLNPASSEFDLGYARTLAAAHL